MARHFAVRKIRGGLIVSGHNTKAKAIREARKAAAERRESLEVWQQSRHGEALLGVADPDGRFLRP